MEKNLQAPQVLLSANVMKSPVLPVFEGGVGRFLGHTEPQQHSPEQ
jgi:hypothetical protein